MPYKKGTWHQCPLHASRAGKKGAANSPWRHKPLILSPAKHKKKLAMEAKKNPPCPTS